MKQPEYVPAGPLFRLLIPPEPRRYTGQRWVKMIVRASHVVLAGVYLGALVFAVEPATRTPWFLAAMLSGLAMVCLDLFESGGFLLQLRGLILVAKLVVLACVPALGAAAAWIVAGVAFVSVLSSHATSAFRYFLVWGRGRIKAGETRG